MGHATRQLGRTGLRISPLAFGVGTFGAAWGEGWSIEKSDAEAIFNRFLDGGMNHIDAADFYHAGESESWTGEFMRNRGHRDRVVLATKATMSMDPENLNGGGNSRKAIVSALDASLRRLKTDYVDLFYAHHWDTVTPAGKRTPIMCPTRWRRGSTPKPSSSARRSASSVSEAISR